MSAKLKGADLLPLVIADNLFHRCDLPFEIRLVESHAQLGRCTRLKLVNRYGIALLHHNVLVGTMLPDPESIREHVLDHESRCDSNDFGKLVLAQTLRVRQSDICV